MEDKKNKDFFDRMDKVKKFISQVDFAIKIKKAKEGREKYIKERKNDCNSSSVG